MTDPYPTQTRWQQRFENFSKALKLLQEPLAGREIDQFTMLEKHGLIKRFDMAFELAWKTMKDYLEYAGIPTEYAAPRPVIKQAFAANIIVNGQTWIDMLEDRNLLSHTYDEHTFTDALHAIKEQYLAPICEFHALLLEKTAE
ncbi:MAG: nucleotidyltransferase substrate binding protein [Alphaproteobacteria bacterium]